MRRTIVLLTCFAIAACGEPKDAKGWARLAVKRNRTDEKLEALSKARAAPGDKKEAVPYLVEVLKQAPRARGQAAVLLGEIGDPAAVKPLIEAIETGARERDTVDANRQISAALGALRAREAVPVLQRLSGSPDGFTQVAAVDALGEIGDPAAVDTLVAIATDEGMQPFTAKKALLALGRIADPRATPAVLKMLFSERPGVTFFPEAAFATYQIGRPMEDPLLAVIDGKDAALSAWAKGHGVVQGALYAKAAQLLGDVGGARAVPPLVQKLSYRDSVPALEMFVRVYAAESLGRMRAKEAVKPISDLLAKEKDPDARERYCDALVRIGDPAALPALRAAAAAGSWEARAGALAALSRLGGESERAAIEAARAKDCAAACPAAQKKAYDAMGARLDAAKACGTDPACWAGKLADPSAGVRDRAALEVGRSGGAAQAGALSDAVARPVNGDDDLVARYHAVLGLSWVSQRAPLGPAGATIAPKLEGVISADKGRAVTAGVNEDVLRLATRLRRQAQ